jgi:hypothetical protein
MKKQYGDRHLAVGHRQLRKQTQGDGGSWKKLATACRGMTHRAIPALCKEHGHQGPGRNNVARGNLTGQTFRKRRRAQLECSNKIRDWDVKGQLRLRSERTSGGIFRKVLVLQIVKQRVEPSVRIRKMNVRALWRGWPPPKQKKRLHIERA